MKFVKVRILKRPNKYKLGYFIGDIADVMEDKAKLMVKNGDGVLIEEEKPKRTRKSK